jgi:hypothetical protein
MHYWISPLLACLITGCVHQDYTVVPRASGNGLEQRRNVLDVTVGPVSRIERVDIVLGESREQTATLFVDQVIKGQDLTRELVLRNYREMSAVEMVSIPGGIHQGAKLRIGFDGIEGERLVNLKIAARPP